MAIKPGDYVYLRSNIRIPYKITAYVDSMDMYFMRDEDGRRHSVSRSRLRDKYIVWNEVIDPTKVSELMQEISQLKAKVAELEESNYNLGKEVIDLERQLYPEQHD